MRTQYPDHLVDAVRGLTADWRGHGLETFADAIAGIGAGTAGSISSASVSVTPPIRDAATVYDVLSALDTEKSDVGHTHDANAITFQPASGIVSSDVQGALSELGAGKASALHTHPMSDVVGLVSALGAKSDVGHVHLASAISFASSGSITFTDVQGAITQLDANKAPNGHTHSASSISTTPGGNLSATNVQTALNQLDTGKAALAHTHLIPDITGLQGTLDSKSPVGHTHAAGVITVTPNGNLTQTDVQAALAALANQTTSTVAATAVSVTPAGNIASTNVQAALAELDAEKALLAHTHAQADITGLTTALAAKEATANKGAANGYASLDASVLVPVAQVPDLAQAKITGLTTALATKEATANRGAANGYASLDGSGLVPIAQVPAIPQSGVTGLTTALAAKEATANKGVANGYASLDASVLVPVAQIPTLAQSKVTNLSADLAARLLKPRASVSQAAAFTLGAADNLAQDEGTGTWAMTIPAAATLGDNFQYTITNVGTGTITASGPGATDASITAGQVATVYVSNGNTYVATAPAPVKVS
jgi:hypothetical protein